MSTKYTPQEIRIRLLRVLAVVLLVAFLVSASLFCISLWEKYHGSFEGLDSQVLKDTVQYKGEKYVLKDNVETYLFLGLDKFDGDNAESYNNDKQADFLMLLIADNDSKTFSALHINRDTVTDINVLGVAGDKIDTVKKQIALAHTYGNGKEVSCRNTAEAVSKLLHNVQIDHYVSVTMDAVPIFNDLVGGVEVTVLDDFSGTDPTLIKGETVTLMGEHALNYVRTRYGLDDSTNNARMTRQRQYINELYAKTQQHLAEDSSFVEKSFLKLSSYIVSDCSANKLQSFMNKLSDYKFIEIYDIDGDVITGETFMEFYPDEESVKETTIKLFYTLKD